MRQQLLQRKTAVVALLSLAMTLAVVGGFVLWARISTTSALAHALRAVAEGHRVPSAIDLKLLGMEVALDDEAKLRTILRTGYKIEDQRYFWQLFPERAFSYSVDVRVEINMICEVYAQDRWVIVCGQINCMNSPCKIHVGADHIMTLHSSPPNTSLERTRGR